MPVFFCYAHEDKDFVDRLAHQLIQRRAWVWIDRWQLSVGDSIVDRVQAAIEEASAVVVVLSRASVTSPWVKRELASIIYRQVGGESAPIVPVLIEDCPIPAFLIDRLYADFRKNFDDGLRTVLEGISSVTSATQGRIETPDFHSDWAVDWGDVGGRVCLRLTLVDHAEKLDFCMLTEVEIVGNDVATMRYKIFAEHGFEWVQHGVLINMAADFAMRNNLQFVLTNAQAQRQRMRMDDESRGIRYEFMVACRWIGTDTGKDILIRVGDSLNRLRTEWVGRVKKPTEEEQREIVSLLMRLP